MHRKVTPNPVLHRTRLRRAGEVHVSPAQESSANVCRNTNAAGSESTKVFVVSLGGFAHAWRLRYVAAKERKARRAQTQFFGGSQHQQDTMRRKAPRSHHGPPVRWRSAHGRACSASRQRRVGCHQELRRRAGTVREKGAPRLSRPSSFHSARSSSLRLCRAPAIPGRG